MQALAYAGSFALLAMACFFVWLSERIQYWKKEAKNYDSASYCPPQASLLARIFRLCAGKFVAFVYLGPLRIKNKHYLKDPRRLLILPNHQTERDAVLIPGILGLRKLRYLIAKTQVTADRAPWVAFTGGIAVDHANSPGSAVRTASRVLGAETDSSCVIFPEGELHRDGHMKREGFHNGAIVIARLAERKSKTEFAALPVFVRYERDRARAGLLQRFFLAMGLDRWRLFYGERTYGVDVYLGRPISLSELPEDVSAATTRVYEEILKLAHEAGLKPELEA